MYIINNLCLTCVYNCFVCTCGCSNTACVHIYSNKSRDLRFFTFLIRFIQFNVIFNVCQLHLLHLFTILYQTKFPNLYYWYVLLLILVCLIKIKLKLASIICKISKSNSYYISKLVVAYVYVYTYVKYVRVYLNVSSNLNQKYFFY